MLDTTSRRRRGSALLATLLALALFATACGNDNGTPDASGPKVIESDLAKDAAGPPVQGGTFTMALGSEPDGWDPTTSLWANDAYPVGWSIFDPLAAYNDKGEPTPYLANSFEHNADFTEWKIGIRPNVTFHDSSAADAKAVAASLTKAKAGTFTGIALGPIKTITATDPLTVTVEMSQPWSLFPHQMANQTGAVISPSMIAAGGDAARKPVGTGPFVFDELKTGTSITASRNPSYWLKDKDGVQLPYFDKVLFRTLTDAQTKTNSFDSGEIDAMTVGDPSQIATMNERAKKGEVKYFDDGQLEGEKQFVALNTGKAPFNDPDARRILITADEPEKVVNLAFDGVFVAARGPFSENSGFYAGDLQPAPSLEKAKELNEAYKAKTGNYLEFTANITPDPQVQRIAQVLVDQMAQANVKVTLVSMEQAALITAAVSGNFQATGFYRFGSPTIDRDAPFITPTDPLTPQDAPQLNLTRTTNTKILDAINASRATDDKQKQLEQYRIVQEEMAKDMGFIWLVQRKNAVVAKNDINGLKGWTLPNGETAIASPPPFLFTAYIWRSA